MKKSVKFVCTAAAVVLTVGVIAIAMFLQSGQEIEPFPASQPEETGPVTLRVVSEFATDAEHGGDEIRSPLHDLLIDIIAEYRIIHPDVKIELTMLPIDEDERSIVLQNMRTEIMAGKGPDVFLSPAGKVRSGIPTVDEKGLHYTAVDPLFVDVEQTMRNRMFLDVSTYYDADTELKTEELHPDVMDAGVYDGCRYVLPLGWNMPIVAVDKTTAKEMGFDEAVFSKGVYDIFDAALDVGDERTLYAAQGLTPAQVCLIPQIFDYDAGSVAMTKEELQEYFTRTASLYTGGPVSDEDLFAISVLSAVYGKTPAFDGTRAFVVGDLTYAPDLLGQALLSDVDQMILPLRATDGSSVAEVTYFGAINANTSHPEEAYEFLRTFLLPEIQHQGKFGSTRISLGINECAWPVRVKDSLPSKWKSLFAFMGTFERTEEEEMAAEEKMPLILNAEFGDDDLPMLFEPIDKVRFANGISFEFTNIADEDIDQRVEKLMTMAKYYIAES